MTTTVHTPVVQGGGDQSVPTVPAPSSPAELVHPAEAPPGTPPTDDSTPDPQQVDTTPVADTIPEAGPCARDTVPARTARTFSVGPIVNICGRAVIAVAVIAAAFLTLLTVPRPAEWTDFTHDMDTGTVSTAQVGQAWQVSSSPRTLTMTLGINPGFDRTPIVVWEAHGQPWAAEIPADKINTDTTDTNEVSTASAALISDTATAADVPTPQVTQAGTNPANYIARAALCMWPVFALFIMLGPTPRRATRTAWVWMGALPMGLGVLAHLFLERPQQAVTEARVLTGGKAFLLSATANTILLTVVTVAWAALAHP